MCKTQNRKVRQALLNAGRDAYFARGVSKFFNGNLGNYVKQGVIRNEIHRALNARMEKERLIAHYFTNTEYNLWV